MNEIQRQHMSIRNAELRKRLIAMGIDLRSINDKLNAITDTKERETAEVEWEYAIDVSRMHPLVLSIGKSIGLTPEQLDDLFQ